MDTANEPVKWPARNLSALEVRVLKECESHARTLRGQRTAIARFVAFWLDRDVLRVKVALFRGGSQSEQLMRDALDESTAIPF